MARAIFVVEDDPSLQQAVVRVLRSEGYHVDAFGTGELLLHAIASGATPESLSCVLIDVDLPGASGISLQRELIIRCPSWRCIFMSGAVDATEVNTAWKNGAWDFLLKPFDLEELLATVAAVFEQPKTGIEAPEEIDHSTELTMREHEVIRMVTSGLLNKQIADVLGLSLRTVKMHRGNAMHKLGFRHVADLVRYVDSLDSV